LEAGFGGEIMGRGDHVARAHDGRAMGLHLFSRALEPARTVVAPCPSISHLGNLLHWSKLLSDPLTSPTARIPGRRSSAQPSTLARVPAHGGRSDLWHDSDRADCVPGGPLAHAVMGGLIGATLLMLVFLPALHVPWLKIKPERAPAPMLLP